MEHLAAGWRMMASPGTGSDGLAYEPPPPVAGLSLFETIEQSDRPDEETYILARHGTAFAVLNVYPYNPGHVLVLPKRAAVAITDLDETEFADLWDLVRVIYQAVETAFSPDGMNVGLNVGAAGGGSVPDHLHVHVVPRWSSDTNFMTSLADTRVLPITLAAAWQRLRDALAAGR